MPIHWDKIPHREIAVRIYRLLGHNSVKRSAESSLRYMLRRRLQFLNAEDHRRFIELEGNDIVAYLRCVRDEYRAFVDEHNCQPVLEAYWVVLRCAIFPTAMAAIRTAVVDYLKRTRVAGRDLSLLFGIPTQSCYREDPIRRLCGPDLKDDTPAADNEVQTVANIVNDDTLAFFRDIHDGGAVWIPCGGGPFALDDGLAIRRSWGLCAMREQMTLTAWIPFRRRLWHQCAPWSCGLSDLFGCVQEELLSQWRALPPESQLQSTSNGSSLDLRPIVVKRSGPKPKARNTVLREILLKQPQLTCKNVCRLMDAKFPDKSSYPTRGSRGSSSSKAQTSQAC